MKKCKFKDCNNEHFGLGYCSGHYGQYRAGKELSKLRYRTPKGKKRICLVVDCNNKYHSNGYCQNHINIFNHFGMNPQDYEDMVKSQLEVCAICNKKCDKNSRLSVDHNHKNNKIRGLLCHKCNTAIGLLGDSEELLYKAIKYLQKY